MGALPELCNERFEPPLQHNPLGELARLQFHTTVEEYQERFCALLVHVEPLSVAQVHLFTVGLPDHIRIDVELVGPPDIQQALRLTRAYERRSQALDFLPQPTGGCNTRQPVRAATPTPSVSAPPVTTTQTGHTTEPTRPFKRLTHAKMDERR